jgi:hypothetical protein
MMQLWNIFRRFFDEQDQEASMIFRQPASQLETHRQQALSPVG